MSGERLFDGKMLILCWNVVVCCCRGASGVKNRKAATAKTIKCLWACYLMYEVPVNKKRVRIARFTFYNVRVPYFFKNCLRFFHNNRSYAPNSLK